LPWLHSAHVKQHPLAVVIGMDPHKRSVTVEVMTGDETVVGHARFGTDHTGYQELLAYAKSWLQRCHGVTLHELVPCRLSRVAVVLD
jgi:hypothetical protein